MQSSTEIFKAGREKLVAARDLVRAGLKGRTRAVTAIAVLAGVASVGFVAATIDNAPAKSLTTVAQTATAKREAVAERADRSTRSTKSNTPAKSKAKQAAPAKAKQAAPKQAKAAAPKAARPVWSTPMQGAPVSSCFGPRWGTEHKGIDFAMPENTPIRAVGPGTVFAAGWVYSGYGISVVVDHGNGYFTHYAHMNRTVVQEGQQVKAGDILGYEGSTGDSTGPHLHFEVHQGMWNQVNPAPWLQERGISTGC
ncbi:hypothetical protein Cs7R123_33910 [Catellatospora sp. TT07R-123]|uniref:M23 family metallopeptidase n=1 Tax=Catellatospora sp. TT07R-123 TaxID=2733863 RepID=UPI001B00047A|nr:M23 family metallopeptidase [Catellatospora sp. TT07R-123]GHJ46049.1 hypothetical protein Cs7R123_33910 [Catellatospora sp. TT07R-123]